MRALGDIKILDLTIIVRGRPLASDRLRGSPSTSLSQALSERPRTAIMLATHTVPRLKCR